MDYQCCKLKDLYLKGDKIYFGIDTIIYFE